MSILNVNKINAVGGGSTITIAGIASVTSSVTAPSFVGAVTGDVTGNLTGTASTSTNAATAYAIDSSASLNTLGVITATSFVGSGANITGISTAATSDFVKIATATWSSAVSSVAIDNLDTTTYKYFRLLWNHKPTEQGRRLSFRWRKDGSDQTTAAYDWNFGETYGSSTTTLAENADKAEITDDMGSDLNEGCQLEFVIYPKTSAESGYHGNTVFWHGIHHENAGYVRGINGSLFYDGGTSYYPNGFKLYMNVNNMDSGNYALYGVKR